YGQLFDSGVGIAGVAICFFWLFTAIFASTISPFNPLGQVPIMKDALPGAIEPETGMAYLFGGDKLARDVFSRMVFGSKIVLIIAPAATAFAFMVGITLGLPAGYYGGRLDTVLSFLANLILAFPVILLFYLLVTPEIVATGLPPYIAVVLFLFPLAFLLVLVNSRYYVVPDFRNKMMVAIALVGGYLYLSLVGEVGTKVAVLPSFLDIIHVPGNILIVFVSVVFVNAPTVFRIIRGIVMDIKTRDYV